MTTDKHHFALKLINLSNGTKRAKPPLEKLKSITKSDDELIETGLDQTALDRAEEARLAEEALASNLKLLKKQKAKFLRLQKILSRNVILLPMCAIFSVLSAATIFASGLLDHYEDIVYDVESLEASIRRENNFSHFELINMRHNQSSPLLLLPPLFPPPPSSSSSQIATGLVYSSTTLSAPNKQHRKQSNENSIYGYQIVDVEPINFFNENTNSNSKNSNNNNNKQVTTTTTISTMSIAANSTIIKQKEIYFYEMTKFDDYLVVSRRSPLANENKTNIIYATYFGIWHVCNNLSDESRKELKVDKCLFYKPPTSPEPTELLVAPVVEDDSSKDLIRNSRSFIYLSCYSLIYLILYKKKYK